MASFDREMLKYMRERSIPGGAVAVVKDRRLVYAKGYGVADRDHPAPVRADSPFRIASLSKPVTAVAVMRLVEEGRLRLEDRAFGLLGLSALPAGATPDPRLGRITIRHLLQHSGGWDSGGGYDPMFRSVEIAQATGTPAPATPEAIIRFMMGRPLDFDPGTRYAYSNFGYCVLGRIIEKASGQPYEAYVREHVLAPLGIRDMRIGSSLRRGRAEGEVSYYSPAWGPGPSVFPGVEGDVAMADGRFCIEAMDAHGGWIASAIDLARLAAGLDGLPGIPLLKPQTVREMHARPEAPLWRNPDGSPMDYFYACGWLVRPIGTEGAVNAWHMGIMPGSVGILVRLHNGLDWVALFNQESGSKEFPDGEIDAALHRAAADVKDWPDADLFNLYF